MPGLGGLCFWRRHDDSHGIVLRVLAPEFAAKVKPSTLTGYDTDELLKQLDAFKAELAEVSALVPSKTWLSKPTTRACAPHTC